MPWLEASSEMHSVLKATLTSSMVAPERDAKINRHPTLIRALAVSHTNSLRLWAGNLTLTLFCSLEEAGEAVAQIHQAVESW